MTEKIEGPIKTGQFRDTGNIGYTSIKQGRIQGGGAHPARPPPPKIGKNMICWRKIVIFQTKYPTNFRASLRSAHAHALRLYWVL